jgi:hypothetical protein
MNYFTIVPVSAKTHGVGVAADHPHAENALVESERAVEIRDLQPHPAEMRRFGEAVFAGAYSALPFRFSRYLTCGHIALPLRDLARPSWSRTVAERRNDITSGKCYACGSPGSGL